MGCHKEKSLTDYKHGAGDTSEQYLYFTASKEANKCDLTKEPTPYSVLVVDDYKRCVCDLPGNGKESDCWEMGSKAPEQPDICHNDATFRDPKTDKCAEVCLDGNYPGKETDLEACYLTAEERVKKL